MRTVVLITGKICTGKSSLANDLANDFDYHIIRTRLLIEEQAKKRNLSTDRNSLQSLGDQLDEESEHKWLFNTFHEIEKNLDSSKNIVIDNIRNKKQLDQFRQHFSSEIVHVHLYAPTDHLQKRFENKRENDSSLENYDQANILKNEDDVNGFKKDADVRINTARSDHNDTLIRVAARLKLYPPPDVKCVDIIVGGQFGSEGKGNVAAYLAKEYDVLVRVGGPNAGHSVVSPSGHYIYHQLPSGTIDTNAEILLGPGMTINLSKLLEEIKDCGISSERLFIDPQAMVIDTADIDKEKEKLVGGIASTGQGGGAAAARRILHRDSTTKLAKDYPELRDFVGTEAPYRGCTLSRLELAYRRGHSVLLEGTQGSGLSLYHGNYPYVTSRDTNVAGCLAEAGISPSRVRKIIMVIRYTPIRVGNPDTPGMSSGPLKHETSFLEVSKEAGLNALEVESNEKTSTTKRPRRVGWFDWELFRRSCALNAPSDIVLTFADYHKIENEDAKRFEQLHIETIKFIEEIERVAQAPVSLISTRFPRDGEEKLDLRNIIDRRNWKNQRKSI